MPCRWVLQLSFSAFEPSTLGVLGASFPVLRNHTYMCQGRHVFMVGVCFRDVNLSSFFCMACATSFCLVCKCSAGRYVCELQTILAFSLVPMCALEECRRVSISQDMNSPSCAVILACSLSLWMWMLESLKNRAAEVLRGLRTRPKLPSCRIVFCQLACKSLAFANGIYTLWPPSSANTGYETL